MLVDIVVGKPVDVLQNEAGNGLSKVELRVFGQRLDRKLLQVLLGQLSLLRLDHLHQRVVVRVGLRLLFVQVDVVFDVFHALLRLFSVDLALHLDCRDLGFSLGLDL